MSEKLVLIDGHSILNLSLIHIFEEVRFMAGFFNIILFELIAWILYFITGRAKWALRAVRCV